MSDSLQPHELQHARPPCPSPMPGVHPNPCPLCRWCHPAILFSSVPSSSSLKSFPASRSFLMSQLFASGGQNTGASASASVLPMNIRGWFLLTLTGLISLQSKGLLRVFSSTILYFIRTYKDACSQSLCPQKTLVCLEGDINRWLGIEHMVKIKQKGE